MDTIIAILQRRQLLSALLVAMLTTMLATPASAAFHFWQIKEVFSNADGSVQFIEMFDNTSIENSVMGYQLQADSEIGGNTVSQYFTFPSNIVGETMNRHLLIATTGFGSLPGGVTPDFTFDQSTSTIIGPFFNPNATNINITFTGSFDSVAFAGPQLPKNGVNSLTDIALYGESNLVSGVNSPTNLAGQSGSIGSSTGPTGDYNGNHTVDAADYVIWRDRLNQSVPAGSGPDGSNNGFVDQADYTFWRSRFGNAAGSGSATPAPEPGFMFAFGIVGFFAAIRRWRR